MKNVQTILLGLVIALGVIYVGYNETRIAGLQEVTGELEAGNDDDEHDDDEHDED